MTNFISIDIEGFGSVVEPITYSLNQNAISVITGDNGVGKTRITNALVWCLFGKTLQKLTRVEPYEWLKGKNYKGTRVTVHFQMGNDHYSIDRFKNYKGKVGGVKGGNRVVVLKNKVESSIKNVKTINNEIEDILGIKYEVFINTIVFGQKLSKIITEKGPKQKEIFESAFEVSYLTKAKDLASKKATAIGDEYREKLGKAESLSKLLANTQSHLESVTKLNKAITKSYNSNKHRLKQEIAHLRERVKSGQAIVSKLDKAIFRRGELEIQMHNLQNHLQKRTRAIEDDRHELDKVSKNLIYSLSINRKDLDYSSNPDNSTCKVCGQSLPDKTEEFRLDRVATLEKDRKALERKLKENSKQIQALPGTEEIESITLELSKVSSEYRELDKTITILEVKNPRNLQPKITKKLKELKTLHNEVEPIEPIIEKITRLKASKKKAERKVEKLEKSLEVYKWLVNDPLSNKGIKNYIFHTMMEQVNSELLKYGNHWGYGIRFSIDLESANKVFYSEISTERGVINYDDLSGGEQQVIDVCVAFAMHDVFIKKLNCNILILDEIFEHLDKKNISLIEELIMIKARGKNIHIITHNKDFKPQGSVIVGIHKDSHGYTKLT
jgi:DNA repair exonuclease SbcCD ATPase subunit